MNGVNALFSVQTSSDTWITILVQRHKEQGQTKLRLRDRTASVAIKQKKKRKKEEKYFVP